jgi:hypothetical protein
MKPPRSSLLRRFAATLLCLTALAGLHAQTDPAPAPSVLFIGNSFTFGRSSPVMYYRPQTVTDLNGEGIGGVPALFKVFADQAGLSYRVSLETSPGKNFDFHLQNKAALIGRAWDIVVMHGYSTLDQAKPGDPAVLVKTGRQLAELLHDKNPRVDIRVVATWSRADLTYPEKTHWHGRPIEQMALDVRAGYDALAASTPFIHGVIPVGEAWNRAIKIGFADPNPYDGIAFGQIDLWTHDHYHASAFGYYLYALLTFGDLTGLDPRALGKDERASVDFGFSTEQTATLQQIAYDELSATKGRAPLKPFTPVKLPR